MTRRSAMFIVGVIAGTVLFEAMQQFFLGTPLWRVLPVAEVSLYGPDPNTGYRHRRGAKGVWVTENRVYVRINNWGLRDRDLALAKAPSVHRIALIGDSWVEGLQVPQHQVMDETAERYLHAGGSETEIINFGLAGATLAVQIERLEKDAALFKPDLVVVMVKAGAFQSSEQAGKYQFTTYSANADGIFERAYGFRETFGYRFRNGVGGALLYAALDHSAVARALNNRKNVGLFQEWRNQYKSTGRRMNRCASQHRGRMALWLPKSPNRATLNRDAKLRDLEKVSKLLKAQVILAVRDVMPDCEMLSVQRVSVIDAMRQEIEGHGLGFVDIDSRLLEIAGTARGVRSLQGFGVRIGSGHLNLTGHRAMGRILSAIVKQRLER